MFERFTPAARTVVLDARAQARQLKHQRVGTEHLLLALLAPEAGSASTVLHEFGLTAEGVRAALARLPVPGGISDADADALRSIGIDLQAVRARLEESFGPGALEPSVPVRSGLFRRRTSFSPFTPRSKKVLELSLREALRLRANEIGTEHLLLGLIREGEGLAAQIMGEAGVDFAALRRATEESVRRAA